MHQDQTAMLLSKIYSLPGFKITVDGGLKIEADGVVYDGSYQCIEEAIFDGVIFILSKIEAKNLIKYNAKIILD